MNIAIIGSGHVGGSLGNRWAALGHGIVFGVRDANSDSAKAVAAQVPSARFTSIQTAAQGADVVLLAVPGDAALATVAQLGVLDGKTLIDATNWFDAKPAGVERSIAEAVAAAAPTAHVVKAFNSTGARNMLNPQFGEFKADMFIAGDDAGAKAVVTELAASIGFDVVDAGPLKAAPMIESLAQLWVHSAFVRGMGPQIAWKMLKR